MKRIDKTKMAGGCWSNNRGCRSGRNKPNYSARRRHRRANTGTTSWTSRRASLPNGVTCPTWN